MQKQVSWRHVLRLKVHQCALAGLTALVLASAAGAQEGNRDYYNPGTESNERDLFKNVHLYHYQQGIDAMGRRDYVRAYSDFVFILRFYPNHPDVLNLMSDLCVNRWKVPKCDIDAWFPKAIARNPNVSKTYVVYGIHLQRQGKRDEAIVELNKALKLQPGSINANYTLGLVYLGKKDYESANRYAQAAYALGAELPGLREQLKRAGKWRPLDNPLPASAGGDGDTVTPAPDKLPADPRSPAAPVQTPPPAAGS